MGRAVAQDPPRHRESENAAVNCAGCHVSQGGPLSRQRGPERSWGRGDDTHARGRAIVTALTSSHPQGHGVPLSVLVGGAPSRPCAAPGGWRALQGEK